MSTQNQKITPKGTPFYRLFKHYVRTMQNLFLYRRVYFVDRHNLPPEGTPVIVVSNHQNCGIDPICLLLGFENHTHPFIIARGSIFGRNPFSDAFFHWLGILPAYRMDSEGADKLQNNAATIKLSGGELLKGQRLIMYPEGKHQVRRWLGEFKSGYTRMAFQTAEFDNFQTDILILPCCNHYSNYTGLRRQFMVRFGTPISLKPYYERYKTKPRTVQREVNKLVREQIENLMLNITDLENYDAIDFIRNSAYGDRFATKNGLNPQILPDKLESDKLLFAKLDAERQTNPEKVQKIYDLAKLLSSEIRHLGIADRNFEQKPAVCKINLSLLAQFLLVPLWIFSLLPCGFIYWLTLGVHRLSKTERLYTNTFVFSLSVIFLFPISAIAALLVLGLHYGLWWQAVVWILLWPLMGKFAWRYSRIAKHTWQDVRFLNRQKSAKIDHLTKIRTQLHNDLDEILLSSTC